MSIRVSIVVPVYNSHATLPKCLDSLIAQTWQDLEIICVNDKSKDNSIDIIKKFQQKDSRVILVDHSVNMNAGGARNSGIKTATGDYVCFCDNDDWMTRDAIETLVNVSDGGRIDFVVPQWCEYYNENRKKNMKNLVVGGSKEENCEYALLHGCRILGCLIKRDLFFKNDLFFPEKTFFEDNAIGNSLLFCANEIKVVNKVLYYYQMTEGSSSRTLSIVRIIDRIKTTDLCINNLKRLGFVNEHNLALVNCRYLCFSYHTIKMLASLGTKEAKIQLDYVSNKIKQMKPNDYICMYHKGYERTLSHPVFSYYIWKLAYSLKRIFPKSIQNKLRSKK